MSRCELFERRISYVRSINIFQVSKLKTFVYLFSFLIRFLELFVFHEYINTSCLDLFSFVHRETSELLIYSIITRNIFINLKISFNRWKKRYDFVFWIHTPSFFTLFFISFLRNKNFLACPPQRRRYPRYPSNETEGSDNNCIYLEHLKDRKVSRNPFSDRFLEIA